MEVYNDTSKKENGTRGRCCRCHQGGHHLSGYGWTPTSAVGMVDEREEDAHRRHQGLDLAKALDMAVAGWGLQEEAGSPANGL
jgi:hypothetical protein